MSKRLTAAITDIAAMRYAVQKPNSLSRNVAGMDEREAMFVNLRKRSYSANSECYSSSVSYQ